MSTANDVMAMVTQLKQEVTKNRTDHDHLHEHAMRLESHMRRNNLKFEGIPETDREDVRVKIREQLNKMGVANANGMELVACHRFGPLKPKFPRPIVVKFLRYEDRSSVWGKRTGLKGSLVRMKEDYPGEI